MDNRIKDLFERYRLGSATKQEQKIVEDWFVRFNGTPDQDDLKDELFDSVDRAIDNLLSKHRRVNWFNNRRLQAAALLLLAVCIAAALYPLFHAKQVVTYSYLRSPNGAKKVFTLPDGSTLYLNSGSEVKIPSDFGSLKREISLRGEAYFAVKHNATRPFIIHSGKLLITDLGTAFNVKAYTEETNIQVAVESGKVKIEKSNPNSKPTLFAGEVTPNHRFTYDEKSDNYTLSQIQPGDFIGWRQNKLRFDNATFSQIAHTLERWYNVPIRLNGTTQGCKLYTVSFNNEPIDHVLNVLSSLSGVSYRVQGKTITLNLKKCGT